jgi:[ribosomal protein S5]-alanine N-acetyltransferase
LTDTPISSLQTERLRLRAFEPQHLDAALRIHCDPLTNQFNPAPFSKEQVEGFVTRWSNDWIEKGIGYWAVSEVSAPETVIGFSGVRNAHMVDVDSFNLYFRFAPSAWGKGYASEVGRVALNAAFSDASAQHVRAMTRPFNTPSIKTIKAVGLKLNREVSDHPGGAHLMFEITRDAFLRQSKI